MVKHLNPNIVYHCENKLLFDDVVMAALLLTYYLSWIFVVTLKQQSTGIDISLHSYTLYWLLSHIHLSSYYSMFMLSRESANTNYWYIVWPYFSYRCSNTWSSLYLSSIHFLDHEGGNDGRDDEDRPEQKTKKQRIETIENTTQ